MRRTDTPYIIAHRGASYCAPENTAAAFRKALELGADGVETDVQLTLDGQLVIHHDYSVDSTSNGHGKIAEMTLAELKALDFGSWKGPCYRGETILTLDECLELLKPFSLVNLELKAPMDRSIPYVQMVVEAVLAHNMANQVILSAFDHSLLREAKQLCPSLRVGALMTGLGAEEKAFLDLLCSSIPTQLPLVQITRDTLRLSPEQLCSLEAMGIPEQQAVPTVLEVIGSFIPLCPPNGTMEDVMGAVRSQEDLEAYACALDFPVEYLHPEYHSVLGREDLLRRLSTHGFGVSPYTPDAPEELFFLWNSSCYGIITNRPDLLLSIAGR